MVDMLIYDNRTSAVVNKGNIIFSILPPDGTFNEPRVALTLSTGFNVVISVERWDELIAEYDTEWQKMYGEGKVWDDVDKPT